MGVGDRDVYVLLRMTTADRRPNADDRLAKIVSREAHLQFGGAVTYLCDAAMAKEFVMDGHAEAVTYDPQRGVDEQMSDDQVLLREGG